MDRRKSIKTLLIGTVGAGVLVEACKNSDKKAIASSVDVSLDADRMQEEKDYLKKLNAGEKFFTEHEMTTITVLGDIIMPKDAVSGSASDAKVPEFIEFIVKDMPRHQVPMRGGLRWLDLQCLNRYNKTFVDASSSHQIEMVTEIAYPQKAKPEMQQGVSFFNRMRDLTASGFFTTKMGIEDLGYVGNTVNKWTGVPADVLKQYGMENV